MYTRGPMNFYFQIQRRSPGYAARVFEELWPVPRIRVSVAQFLRSFLERAAVRTTAWSVTLDPDSVRLNVGPVQVLGLESDSVWFCALGAEGDRWPDWVEDLSARPIIYPSVSIRSRVYGVRPARVGTLPVPLAELALLYVDQAASRRTGKSAWYKSNSLGVLGFLESYLDCTLPRPLGDSAIDSDFIPEPTEMEDGGTYPEGATRQVTVNAYERSRAARAQCLEHHGLHCLVCGELLSARYGEIAAGLIHVHHLLPLSEIRSGYHVDPIKDLRPVCPNCHAVLHRRNPPLSIEEARGLLA
jgi:5-methylcytosine-specific restriction enzyme A